MIQTQKNELNVFQNEEKNNENQSEENEIDEINKQNDCFIF